jgi:formylglycine-generating enzyme required for sulfatase activity
VIAETETTWALWKEVYDWATDTERGDKVYTFANTGRMGGDNGANLVLTPQHPVSAVNWDDAMVWCNALTEYFNAANGTAADLECVYTCNNAIIRSSTDDALCITAVQSSSAKGFRLLTSCEWEFAARYIGPADPAPTEDETYRNYLTKDTYCGHYYQEGGTSGLILWHGDFYTVTGVPSTAEVKSKKPNCLGVYDMSGNVAEWCFDVETFFLNPKARVLRGGGFRFTTDDTHEVGYESENYSYIVDTSYGFRLAKNPD